MKNPKNAQYRRTYYLKHKDRVKASQLKYNLKSRPTDLDIINNKPCSLCLRVGAVHRSKIYPVLLYGSPVDMCYRCKFIYNLVKGNMSYLKQLSSSVMALQAKKTIVKPSTPLNTA